MLRVWSALIPALLGVVFVTIAGAQDEAIEADSPAMADSLAAADSGLPAAPAETESEPETPLVYSAEVGGGASRFTQGYGDAYHMLVRVGIERPYDWSWLFNVGVQSRFEEYSIDGGVTYTKIFRRETELALGIGSGTGKYIASEYSLGVSLAQPIWGTLVRVGYTREQSKAENYRDGFGVGLDRWFPHWIVGAHWRYDIGHPGDTVSQTFGLGLSYYLWEKFTIGTGVDYGDVSYLQVGPTDFLVNYDSEEYRLGVSYWFNPQAGMNFNTTYGETPFYEVTGWELSFFRRW